MDDAAVKLTSAGCPGLRGAVLSAVMVLALAWPAPALAQEAVPQTGPEGQVGDAGANPLNWPDLRKVLPPAKDRQGVSAAVEILLLLTVLSLAPAIVVLMTSFTRIVVVLALIRQAMGTQQLPPNQVIIGLALLMTMLIMTPTWQKVHSEAISPYMNNQISQTEAIERAKRPLRQFMFDQIEACDNNEDIYMFVEYGRNEPVEQLDREDVPTTALIPAFVTSELKTAFVMGFRIYLPFLIIDMVVASVLISMGMIMLPPVLISLPFKLLLFVLADGWHLVIGTLMRSFT